MTADDSPATRPRCTRGWGPSPPRLARSPAQRRRRHPPPLACALPIGCAASARRPCPRKSVREGSAGTSPWSSRISCAGNRRGRPIRARRRPRSYRSRRFRRCPSNAPVS
eukprot:1190483-Prorocentrum_minimum.AAC.4